MKTVGIGKVTNRHIVGNQENKDPCVCLLETQINNTHLIIQTTNMTLKKFLLKTCV